jgi:hypothetical protein
MPPSRANCGDSRAPPVWHGSGSWSAELVSRITERALWDVCHGRRVVCEEAIDGLVGAIRHMLGGGIHVGERPRSSGSRVSRCVAAVVNHEGETTSEIGPAANRVVREAACPVLTVRGTQPQVRAHPP